MSRRGPSVRIDFADQLSFGGVRRSGLQAREAVQSFFCFRRGLLSAAHLPGPGGLEALRPNRSIDERRNLFLDDIPDLSGEPAKTTSTSSSGQGPFGSFSLMV